jgi:hypothetical protein
MHTGTCPSCDSTEIYAARNGLGFGEGAYVGIRPHIPDDFRGAASLHRTKDVWSYLCASCGLIEHRLHDRAALDFVEATWTRVAAPG